MKRRATIDDPTSINPRLIVDFCKSISEASRSRRETSDLSDKHIEHINSYIDSRITEMIKPEIEQNEKLRKEIIAHKAAI